MSLVPTQLKELFAESLDLSADCYLRARLEHAGLKTGEVLTQMPNGSFNSLLSMREQINGYFAQLDWNDRREIAKILPFVEEALVSLVYHPSHIYKKAAVLLADYGLE